ncbi:MAG: hypothetical protein EXR75_06530 [Myxococcales bacterium]|nr:hypothetical protein [Myxococcales bacterium]
MTEAMFQKLLSRAGATTPKRGPSKLPEGTTATLYAAADGASLTVAQVVEVSLADGIVEAKNKKGEIYLLGLEHVFSVSLSGTDERGAGRKAGFVA